MRAIRWLSALVPAILVAAVVLGGFAAPGWRSASDMTYMAARLCPSPTDYAALRAASQRSPAAGVGATVSSVIDTGGELSGRLASLSLARGATRTVTLANESFVSLPVGNLVVYGQHEPRSGSTARVVDLVSGCEWTLPAGGLVVRSAAIDRQASALYVHSVSPRERLDAGVARHDLRSGASAVVLEPLAAEPPFGTTYATLLRWSVDGAELAVTACGWLLCQTRVLDTASGSVQSFKDHPHGELVAVTAANLYAFEACDQWPCGLLAIERSTGQASELEAEVISARLSMSDGAAVIVVETSAGTREIQP